MLRRRWPILALAAFTCFVWLTRIANAQNDAVASTATKVVATALSLSFLALAVVSVIVVVRARGRRFDTFDVAALRAFAGWTASVWLVRATQITVADHTGDPAITNPTAFKVVHLVLGVVSVALAAWAWRVVARDVVGESSDARDEVHATDPGGGPSQSREPVSPAAQAGR